MFSILEKYDISYVNLIVLLRFQGYGIFRFIRFFWSTSSLLKLNSNNSIIIIFIKRLIFLATWLYNYKLTKRWVLGTCNKYLTAEIQDSPLVFLSICRPYIHKDWNFIQRYNAIEHHYSSLTKGLAIFAIRNNEYFSIIELDYIFPHLSIVVDRPHWLRKEGEVSINLCIHEKRYYTSVFIFGTYIEKPCMIIGGYQGASYENTKVIYKELTKATHGLRPRDFLFEIIKIIASHNGIESILGIDNSCHRIKHALVRGHKSNNYNEIWIEQGGLSNNQGFFLIPTTSHKRNTSDIPSRKRSMYIKRYLLIDKLEKDIINSLENPCWKIMEYSPKESSTCA